MKKSIEEKYLGQSVDGFINDINALDEVIINAIFEAKEKGKDEEEAGYWSADVETEWTPKEGLFTQSAPKIASYLAANSDSLKQAMSRLNFYINRAGSKLSDERKGVLERAKKLLRKRFGGD